MARTCNNIFIKMVKHLIENEEFKKELNILSSHNYSHFEKWLQIKFGCTYDKNKFNHYKKFNWYSESKMKDQRIIPDFTLIFSNDVTYYIEIKQHNSFITCIKLMVSDFMKISDLQKKNKDRILCIGLFKTKTFNLMRNQEAFELLKKDLHKNTICYKKLEKLVFLEIQDTEYSIMYF